MYPHIQTNIQIIHVKTCLLGNTLHVSQLLNSDEFPIIIRFHLRLPMKDITIIYLYYYYYYYYYKTTSTCFFPFQCYGICHYPVCLAWFGLTLRDGAPCCCPPSPFLAHGSARGSADCAMRWPWRISQHALFSVPATLSEGALWKHAYTSFVLKITKCLPASWAPYQLCIHVQAICRVFLACHYMNVMFLYVLHVSCL